MVALGQLNVLAGTPHKPGLLGAMPAWPWNADDHANAATTTAVTHNTCAQLLTPLRAARCSPLKPWWRIKGLIFFADCSP